MCTTVVSVDPHSPVPVLLLGVRDEFLDRAWLAPGRHWPEHPALVGGQDLQAFGTWLAVDPDAPRVACVLNAHGTPAPDSLRLTRGTLPLRVAVTGVLGEPDELDAARYDPFHLISASPDVTRIWSWDGQALRERTLGTGLHVIVNSGLEGTDDHDGPGSAQMQARIGYFRPLFEKAPRPEPGLEPEPEPETEPGLGPRAEAAETAWGAWLPLAAGGGLDPSDPRALVLRRTINDRPWGTSSLSLVALTRTSARYDFCANPAASRPVWSRTL